MASDQQSGRYSQPIVNGQSSESSLSSYSTGKTVYSTDSVLSSKLSSQPSSIVGSARSQPNSSSSNVSQRFPTSSLSDQSRNFSSSQSSNSPSVNQTSSNSSSYKSSADNYKPSDSYKQTSDSYKSQSDSYKSSSDSYKSSADGNKTSADSYKSSTDNYKSSSDRSNATIGGSSATSAQNYKSDNPSNTSSSASNAYKPSNLESSSNKSSSDVSQNRAPAPGQNNATAGQSMRTPENRPANNYQQPFQNQQRPNTTSSNLQPNSAYQTPQNQSSNQPSNYQQNFQTQRQTQPPSTPQIKRESSNSSISRPSSAFASQNATNQSFQRPATAVPTQPTAAGNPPQAQRPYSPNPPSAANQPPRPMSPSAPRPPLSQQPGAPRPPSFQTNASPRPMTPNYQQSTTVPTRVNINQRPNSTNQNLYSNTPNYGVNAAGVRTGPLTGTSASSMYQRGGVTNQPRYSDAGIRPLGTDPRLGALGSIRPASPLSGYSIDDDKRRMYSSLLTSDQLPMDGLTQSALQSGKLKNLINKNLPGEKQTLANEIMKIRQSNLVGATIGSFKSRIESEAAKSGLAKKSSNAFSNFIQNDIMKAIRENKLKLEAQKSEKNLLKQKSKKDLGEKKKKKRRVKKKKMVRRKKKKPEDSEDGEKKSESDTMDEKKPKENGTGENDDDEYEEVEIEVSEEEEVTDSESDNDLDDDDDEEVLEASPDGPASVTNSIKFFEKRDKAKKPVLPKFPVPFIPVEKKPKPDSLPVNSDPPEIIRSESIVKSDYKSGVDESPVIHPNLKKASDVPPKVAKINLDLIHKHRTDRGKSGNTVRYASQPNTPGKTPKRTKSANNGRASYPGTPTKGKPSALKQHSSPGTPKKRMPPFNPEEELLRLFNDPKSKFFRRRWDGDHDSGVEENDRKDHRPTTNGDIDSPKKTPSKLPGPTKKSMSATSPTKTPLKSPGTAKSLPKTPETPGPPTPLIKKVPMNKIQVGAAPSPNLKAVRSKIGSLANTTHRPGGGHVKIESHKVDFSKAQPRIEAKNDTYAPGGGDKKIQQVKLQWQAKPKVGSLDNATYKPKGGEKKIESVKLDFKDKAKPKVGSKENVKHVPGGGAIKIENQKLEFKAQSKIGSLDNVKYKPGGGDVKIFDDKTYLKQISAANSEGRASGTQSPMHTSVSKSFSETSQDES